MLARLWKKQIPLMVGIDIGTHSIKAVLLNEAADGGGYEIAALFHESMSRGAMVERDIQDIDAIGRIVGKIQKRLGKRAQYAACAVSGSTVITKIIYMDASLTDEELASQIEIEADALIPYPLDEVSLDFEPLGKNEADPTKVNVLLSAARKEMVQSRVSAIAEGGLETKVVDVEPYALARAARELCFSQLPDDAADKRVAVLDIGANLTQFAVLEKGETVYTRDQLFGGEQYTKSIASYYGKEPDEAEAAKISQDLPPNHTFEVLAPFQTNLIQQARRAIQMYITSSGADKVDYLLLSGGTSLMPELDKLLTEELGVHTVVANPLKQMKRVVTVDKKLIERAGPQFMIATGLALRSFSPWHI